MSRMSWGGVILATGLFLVPAMAQACGPVNLDFQKTGPGTASVGGTITYQIRVTQTLSGTVHGLTVLDKIPDGMTFNSGSSYRSCRVSGPDVLCQYDILSTVNWAYGAVLTPGQTWSFPITFNVVSNPPGCEVNNVARVISFETAKNGPKDSNTVNTKVQCVTVTPTPTPTTVTPTPTSTQTPDPTPTPEITPTPPPGLKIVKTDGGRVLTRPDDGFAYTLTVTNTGSADLEDAVVSDTVPGQFKIIGVSKGGSFKGQVATWKLPHLNPNQSTKVNITVQTNSDVKDQKNVCNTGKVTGNGLTDQSKDCIDIEQKQVKAAQIVKPKQVPVKVTAKTGGGMGMIVTSLLSGVSWTVFRVIRSRRSF